MRKLSVGVALLCSIALGCVALTSGSGCSSINGDVTADQQKSKKDALQKVADEHADPNREQRPQ